MPSECQRSYPRCLETAGVREWPKARGSGVEMALRFLLGGAIAFLALCEPVWARAIYEYEGSAFDTILSNAEPPAGSYTTSMSLDGVVEFAEPLPPNLDGGLGYFADVTSLVLAFSFTDGRHVLTESNSGLSLQVRTDGSGAISEWALGVEGPDPILPGDQQVRMASTLGGFLLPNPRDLATVIECVSGSCGTDELSGRDTAVIDGQAGTWTFVPEPSTAWLLGLGLAGLASSRRGRVVSSSS